jgi:1-acyl-sn-glycerol-3-phosphate acyltransferase
MSATSTTGKWQDLARILFFVLFVRPFMALWIGLRVHGREHVPEREPFILIANHSSHLDTLSLLSLFPLSRLSHIRPCAAADYFERNRVVSFFSHTFFNILPIARINARLEDHPIRRMCEALDRGESLILFPEGTRGQGGEPASFRPGVALLAEKYPQVPVIPAYLANMGRALPKGEFVPVPFFCEVRFGPPPRLEGTREQILDSLHQAVAALRRED